MKTCIGCKQEKPLKEFGEYRATRDGLNSRCRECCRERDAEYRKDNIVKVRALGRRDKANQRERDGAALTRAKWRQWYNDNHAHRRNYENADYEENSNRWAKAQVRTAIANGTLCRPDACEICNYICTPVAHHADYSKPLEVQWLCVTCHATLHVIARAL